MNVLDKLLGRIIIPDDYELQKQIAVSGSDKNRLALAKNPQTKKEILFYLAENDTNPKVRQAVAENAATPLHANATLSIDENIDVRMALAARLMNLLPDLSLDTQSQLYAYTVQALGTLALDEVLKVRKSLTSTLKDKAYTPPAVAAQLARDIEREVAEPILRFCVALEDEVILDILSDHPKAWAAEAVAQRKKISAKVSKAVIKTGHPKAGVLLLENPDMVMNPDILKEIITRAKEFPEWHEPLLTKHKLPKDAKRHLARYVDTRIRKILDAQEDFDLQTTEIVTDTTRRRIQMDENNNKDEPAAIRVNRYLSQGRLNEETLSDYLALRDREFFFAALATLTGATPQNIENAFSIRKPKVVCAICWRAGLSMRFALRLQQEVANVPTRALIYPKNGTEYPLEEKDMRWQLEFLDIK